MAFIKMSLHRAVVIEGVAALDSNSNLSIHPAVYLVQF